jgi:hypothetical protein
MVFTEWGEGQKQKFATVVLWCDSNETRGLLAAMVRLAKMISFGIRHL